MKSVKFVFFILASFFILGFVNKDWPLPNRCLNPVIRDARFEDFPVSSGWTLLQSTIHQRHMDRWLYEHDDIHNICWPHQINSSSSAQLKYDCDYDTDCIWLDLPQKNDPYASPLKGTCYEKQLTIQGIYHAKRLGNVLRRQYMEEHKLLDSDCNSIGLETVVDQKNQKTIEMEYTGLCNKKPSLSQYPEPQVLFREDQIVTGRPIWLAPRICTNLTLDPLMKKALQEFQNSSLYNTISKFVPTLFDITKPVGIQPEQYAGYLDSLYDCSVCHECLGLSDVPEALTQDGLLARTDYLETQSRLFGLDYYADTGFYSQFASNNYGPYFVVLKDRMMAKINGVKEAKNLYIQVTSDSVITPQLRMLGFEEANHRPPWGSTLIYELYSMHEAGGKGGQYLNDYAVRILFNGKTMTICGKYYCTMKEFLALLTPFIPSKRDCGFFYDRYTPL